MYKVFKTANFDVTFNTFLELDILLQALLHPTLTSLSPVKVPFHYSLYSSYKTCRPCSLE